MSIEKIDIQIEDSWKYGLVAFFVDREDFLEDVEINRKRLKINKLLDRKKVKEQTDLRDAKATIKKYGSSPYHGMVLHVSTKFDDLALDLQHKYKKSNNFQSVIMFAVISGIVTEEDLGDEEPMVFVTGSKTGRSNVPLLAPNIAIIINPETHPDDLKRKYIEYIKYNKSDSQFKQTSWILPDVVTNIKRDRGWYWQHKSGHSYKEIWEETPKKERPATVQGVINAIKRYKEHLL